MEIKFLKSPKSLTMTELIVVMVLFTVVILASAEVIIYQFKYFKQLQTEQELYSQALYAIRHICKHIADSGSADIAGDTLTLYDKDRNLTGTYALSGTALTYNTTETVSNKIKSLIYKDFQNPANTQRIKLLNVKVTTEDSGVPYAAAQTLEYTALLARHTYTPPPPGVIYNITRKIYYDKTQFQQAINEAAAGDEIRCMGNIQDVFDGIFNVNISITKSLTLKGGYNYEFAVQDTINTPTTIDAGDTVQAINSNISSGTLTIDGFVIKNGRAKKSIWPYLAGNGGGVYVLATSSIINITNNTITNNAAEGSGGGVCFEARQGSNITLKNNRVATNTSSAGGGGIAFVSYEGSTITITNNTITDNESKGGGFGGGGIYLCTTQSTVYITNNIISNNNRCYDYGGGINAVPNSSSILYITNNIITNNSSRASGGGIYADANQSSRHTINNNTITNNTSGLDGGGIYALSNWSAPLTISNNRVTDNTSNINGGGIFAYPGNTGIITLTNNIITGNTATGTGGGVYANAYAIQYPTTISLTNNTITGNTAVYSGTGSGGIYIISRLTTLNMYNSIIYGNSGGTNANLYGTPASVTYSDIGGYAGAGTNGNIDQDPLFVGTLDYRLQYTDDGDPANDSPCIDTGSPYTGPSDDIYLDPADPDNPGDFTDLANIDYGTAKLPARLTRRNDMGACGGSQAALPTMPDPDDATVTLTAKIIKDDGTLDDMVMPVGAYVFTKDDPNTSQNETAIGVY